MQMNRTDTVALQDILSEMDAALVQAQSHANRASTAEEQEEWEQRAESIREAFGRTLVSYQERYQQAG